MPFNPLDTILDFLQPVNKYVLSDDQGYQNNRLGNNINAYETNFPSLDSTDIIVVGCGEIRGAGGSGDAASADAVRKELYQLYHWHKEVNIADAGNIKPGATLQDSYAALKAV